MPSFCPDCGSKLPTPNPNYCPNCGKSLGLSEIQEKRVEPRNDVTVSINDLGNKLEECVEQILVGMGFDTERRSRIKGKSGVLYEIDVVAKKGQIFLAVECKNWKNPVGWEKIGSFRSKLEDLGSRWNGVYVSYPGGFTEPAEDYAERYNIDTWHTDFLMREFLAVSVGRAEYVTNGKRKTVKNALPLNFDFHQSSEFGLKNRKNVYATGMLSYHPYIVITYSFSEKYKDPTKKTHTFRDKGKIFIDGLDGSVLNPRPGSTQALSRTLKMIVSKDARETSKRKKSLITELDTFTSLKEYIVEGRENYKVRIMEPVINPRSAKKSAIEFIIEKNTHTVKYSTNERLLKTIVHVPKRRNINIKCITLVNIPRWDIYYQALSKTYSREVLGCSGSILEDTIRFCPKHTGLLKKENIAVCEVCGIALCDKHIFECPICGKWLCIEDGILCNNCKRVFCSAHELHICGICNESLCNDCRVTCSLCNKNFCQNHAVICSNCERQVCPDCYTRVGRIRRKKFCKVCLP